MGTIALIFLTAFAAVVCGAVLLIKLGGWLAIASAIVVIMYYFLSTSILIILFAADAFEKRRLKNKEEQKI